MTNRLDALLDRRSEPEVRAVLGDLSEETGQKQTRLGVALFLAADDDDAADADDVAADAAAADAADTAADADDVAADAADTDTDTDTDAAAAAAADAAAAAADAADADDDADAAALHSRQNKILYGEIDMRNGLKLVQLPGRYGYSVTRIGWLRRVSGDEWELLPGARSVVRERGLTPLDKLASGGPKDHRLTEPSEGVEELHRLLIRRALPASERAWKETMPKPEGWIEE